MKTYAVYFQNLTLYVLSKDARAAIEAARHSSINYEGGLGRFLGIHPLSSLIDMHLADEGGYADIE